MDTILQLVQVQASMMLFLGLGFYCRKIGIINDVSEKSLSTAITDVVFPCMIFHATVVSLETIDWKAAGTVSIASVILLTGSLYLGKLLFRKYDDSKKPVLVLGALISNAAFIGLPLVSGTYGVTGVFYTTIYMTVSRVYLWTVGVALFPNGDCRHPALNVITHPNSIAMFLAAFYHYLLPFEFPAFVMDAINEVGSMSTVFCMVMVGSLLPGAKFKDLAGRDVMIFSAVRLLLIPLLLYAIMRIMKLDAMIIAVMTIIASTPAPTLGSVLASRYGADKKLASCMVLTTTLLSLATIPLLALLYC